MSNQTSAPAATMSFDEFNAVIAKNCADAGLEVMEQIIGILYNRETVTPEVLLALTPEQITDIYNYTLGPAIDRIENDLLNG